MQDKQYNILNSNSKHFSLSQGCKGEAVLPVLAGPDASSGPSIKPNMGKGKGAGSLKSELLNNRKEEEKEAQTKLAINSPGFQSRHVFCHQAKWL